MNSPKTAYLTAAIAALRTALTSAGYSNASQRVRVQPRQGQPFPYIEVDPGPVLPWRTKNSEGGEITPTFMVWSDDPDEALSVSNLTVATLSSRTSPPLPSGYTLGPYGLDIEAGLVKQTAAGNSDKVYYGYPVRIRARLSEAA